MSRDRTLQRNAADPQQVRYAARSAERRLERFAGALRSVLATPQGRIVVWGILGWAPPDQAVYDPSGSTMYFKEGQRNVTLRLKAEAIDVDEDLYQLMEREQRQYQKQEDRGAESVRTTAATEEAIQ